MDTLIFKCLGNKLDAVSGFRGWDHSLGLIGLHFIICNTSVSLVHVIHTGVDTSQNVSFNILVYENVNKTI